MKKNIHPKYHTIKVEMTDGHNLRQNQLGVQKMKF